MAPNWTEKDVIFFTNAAHNEWWQKVIKDLNSNGFITQVKKELEQEEEELSDLEEDADNDKGATG